MWQTWWWRSAIGSVLLKHNVAIARMPCIVNYFWHRPHGSEGTDPGPSIECELMCNSDDVKGRRTVKE
jgi:hypothetical protein